jgi:hypothetical protein
VSNILGHFHPEMRGIEVSCIQPLEVDDGSHPPVLLFHQKYVADEAGRRGNQGNLLYGPFLEQSLHLEVDERIVRSLQWSGEANSWAGERRQRRERSAIAFHGLEQMRGVSNTSLQKGRKWCSLPLTPRWTWVGGNSNGNRGRASGLWTLSPGPPPLPPLKDLLLLLALPLLGGRAMGFSRGPRLVGLLIWFLPLVTPLLGVRGAEVRGSLGAVRDGLKTTKLSRLQHLIQPRVVVDEEGGQGRFADLQCRLDCFGCGGVVDQAPLFFNPLVEDASGNFRAHERHLRDFFLDRVRLS